VGKSCLAFHGRLSLLAGGIGLKAPVTGT
jgi:hypothetical protein